MGTTTDYLKRSDRPLWPTKMYRVDDDFSVFLGGTGNCGLLQNGNETLLINCNSGPAAEELFKGLGDSQKTLIVTSNFSDYAEGVNRSPFEKIYVPEASGIYSGVQDVQVLDRELEILWGDESVCILPVEGGFSKKDLVVYLKNRNVLFLGGLFFNGIHPIIDSERGLDARLWIKTLEDIKHRFYPKILVPHEGDLCGVEKLEEFTAYLKALSDPKVEFSYCRENFDWPEIPGYTSLEENFDQIRKNF